MYVCQVGYIIFSVHGIYTYLGWVGLGEIWTRRANENVNDRMGRRASKLFEKVKSVLDDK